MGSKLKGDAVADLTSQTSIIPNPSSPPRHTDNPSSDLHEKHTTDVCQSSFKSTLPQEPTENPSSHTSSPPSEPKTAPSNTANRSKRQSLSQRWKERHGVPEPKDEHGRGVYSGKTTEELVQQARSQVVDGRVVMEGAGVG